MNEQDRKRKGFWVVKDCGDVELVTGFSTDYENVWWIPALGFSGTIGFQLFHTQRDALEASLKSLQLKEKMIKEKIEKLGTELLILLSQKEDPNV